MHPPSHACALHAAAAPTSLSLADFHVGPHIHTHVCANVPHIAVGFNSSAPTAPSQPAAASGVGMDDAFGGFGGGSSAAASSGSGMDDAFGGFGGPAASSAAGDAEAYQAWLRGLPDLSWVLSPTLVSS